MKSIENTSSRSWTRTQRVALIIHLVTGALLGVLLLHPATMVIYWMEFRPGTGDLASFVFSRMAASLSPRMLGMNVVFILLGAIVGGAFYLYHLVLARRKRVVRSFTRQLATDVRAIIRGGENDHTEFKSTARWDSRHQRVNKELESVLVKTIAGFLNHEGGSLLVGVSDRGEITGLEPDYQTLKHKNRDGFEQLVMSLVKEHLGGHLCSFVHAVFVAIDGVEICRLVVEPYELPVYVNDRGAPRYFVRTGNGTRELDVREAVEYIRQRQKRGRLGERTGRDLFAE